MGAITNVDTVTSDSALPEAFLGTVTAAGDKQPWVVELELSGQSIAFNRLYAKLK